MIRTAVMRNLGQHEDQTLALFTDLDQWVDISGPSKRGKTTLMRGLSFCMWGEDVDGVRLNSDFIRDGAERVETEMVLLNGTAIERTMTHKRSITRTVRKPGKTASTHSSEVSMLEALGQLGQDHDLARLVMFPMSWVADAMSGGDKAGRRNRGRALRDKLVRILPTSPVGDVVARLMKRDGLKLLPSDPLDEGDAKKLLTDANRDANKQRGAVEAIEDQIVRAEERAQTAAQFSTEVLARAQAVLDLSAAWSTYETHGAEVGAYEREVQARSAWQGRKAALCERPDDNAAEVERTTKARDEARAAYQAAVEAHREARDRAATARDAVSAARSAPLDTDTPEVRAANAAVEKAASALEIAEKAAEEARAWDPSTADEVVTTNAALQTAAITAERAAQAAAAKWPSGPCTECGSEEWPKAHERQAHREEASDAATRDLAAAEEDHAAAIRAAGDRKAHHISDCEAEVEKAASALREASASWSAAVARAGVDAEQAKAQAVATAMQAAEQATATVERLVAEGQRAAAARDAAEAARDAAVKAGTAAREWDAALRALGTEPTVRPAPATAGTPPSQAKPTQAQVDEATQTIHDGHKARGAADQRGQTITELREDLTAAQGRRDLAEAEAARCKGLLKCVQEAPSEAIRESIEGLDAGPVTLHLEGTGIKMRVNGRRWQVASDGELVIADLYFRAALRKHLQLAPGVPATYLPLFVDRAQAVVGIPWPNVPGPVVRFFTAKGDLHVVRHDGGVA